MTHPANTLSLVADIGGTNTRCALADGLDILEPTIRRYSNADYSGLEAVLQRYMADEGDVNPAASCVAVAGPVRDGRATLTNLNWTIDRETLARATKAETVAILNDLQAQGHAIADLKEGSLREIIAGPEQAPSPNAVKLVVGV
jgi:glucokinase